MKKIVNSFDIYNNVLVNKFKMVFFFAAVIVTTVFFCNFSSPLVSASALDAPSNSTKSETKKIDNTVISWGIRPNKMEQTPTPPAGSTELLTANNGFFVGDTSTKNVYFTFDLGYEAGYTSEVLDILKNNGIKAVFFLCGNYLKEEALINRMLEDGHFIGNHTDKHKDLPTLNDEQIKKDIVDFDTSYKQRFPSAPTIKFFRPPQGRFSASVLRTANGEGLRTALWSIAIVDWGKSPINAAESSCKIAERVHNGAVILSHITNSGTPKMLKMLVPKLAEKGYVVGNPADLLNS